MVICLICNKEFINNSGGQLTNHLKESHSLSMFDYVVLTEYGGEAPKCICGYCNESPRFDRGKFSKYAVGHNKYEWLEEQYVLKYGQPKCVTCGNPVKFKRGVPNKYCQFKCLPCNWNQEKVKNTVKEKYGVENVSQIEVVKEKIKQSLSEKSSEEKFDYYQKAVETKVQRYGNSKMDIQKFKNTMMEKYGVEHPSQTKEFRENSSKRMVKNNPMTDFQTVKKQTQTFAKNFVLGKIRFYKTKRYKDTDLYYQSSYELNFLEYCEQLGIITELENGKSFNYLSDDKEFGYFHLPDFMYKNNVIEIKSAWILDRQGGYPLIEAKRRAVESQGYNYVVILDNDFSQLDLNKESHNS